MARKATSQDVADLAGVSRSAVSLVLNGRAAGSISAQKQATVRAAAAELNYTPNEVALSLRTRRTRMIGVITPTRELAASAGSILRAAITAATASGYLLLIMDSGGSGQAELAAVERLRDRQVDGLLLVGTTAGNEALPEPLSSGPVVLANRVDPDGRVLSLLADDEEAALAAVDLLVRHGHREIALVLDPAAADAARLGFGYARGLAAAGLAPAVPVRGGPELDSGWRATREILARSVRPTAVIIAGERPAVGLSLAAADAGVRIPDGLSVVNVGTLTGLAATLPVPLTSLQRPDREIGELAVRLLLQQLTAPDRPLPQEIRVRYTAVDRASVGSVPTGSAGSARA